MKTQHTDILIIGTSLYAIAQAIELGKAGKEVLITESASENVTRGFYFVGPTPFNNEPEVGYVFHDKILDILTDLGVKFSLDFQHFDDIIFSSSKNEFTLTGFQLELKTNHIIYAPNLISTIRHLPFDQSQIGTHWSSCAWSDAVFFKNACTGVYGNGSWAANQALMAESNTNKVTIYNPDNRFVADSYLIDELNKHKISIINNCKDFTLVSDAKDRLTEVQYLNGTNSIRKKCSYVFDARTDDISDSLISKFPKVNQFHYHQTARTTFDHAKEFELGSKEIHVT